MKAILAVLAIGTMCLRAEIKTEMIEYQEGNTVLEGFVAYDTAGNGSRPAVLIAHQWKGLGPYEKKRAEMLVAYGNAVHSFTDSNAGKDNSTGSAYNEKADKRSWAAMQSFFGELWP